MSLAPVGELFGDPAGVPDGQPAVAGGFDGDHLLVPILAPSGPGRTDQVEIAAALARASDARLSVVDPVPDGRPEVDALGITGACEEFLDSRSVIGGVLRAVRTRDVDTLVLPSGSRGGRLRTGLADRIAARADCDVVVVNGRPGYEAAASILLPVAGGPHSGLAADLARAVAEDCDAWIDVLHVIGEDAPEREHERASELVERVSAHVARPDTTTTWVLESGDVAGAIAEQSRYYGLTVLGAPTAGRLRQLAFGSTTRSVRANAGSVVLSARNNSDAGGWETRGRDGAPGEEGTRS